MTASTNRLLESLLSNLSIPTLDGSSVCTQRTRRNVVTVWRLSAVPHAGMRTSHHDVILSSGRGTGAPFDGVEFFTDVPSSSSLDNRNGDRSPFWQLLSFIIPALLHTSLQYNKYAYKNSADPYSYMTSWSGHPSELWLRNFLHYAVESWSKLYRCAYEL